MATKNTPATKENNAPALIQQGETFDLSKMKLKQRLVMPTISIKTMKEGDAIYLRADGEIHFTEQTDEKTGETKTDKDGKPSLLPIMHATDINSGTVGQVVLPAVALKGFKRAAEQGPLQGRFFAMKKGASTGTGKANLWEVVEFTMGE